MQYIPLPSELLPPKQCIPYSTDIHHTPTLHNHAKHQTSGLYNAENHLTCSTIQLLNYTKPTYSSSIKFRLAMTAYDYNCIYIMTVFSTHKDGPLRTKLCIKSDSLYSCYLNTWQWSPNCTPCLAPDDTTEPTGLRQYSRNMLTLCPQNSKVQLR
jgi:hypothetical protein